LEGFWLISLYTFIIYKIKLKENKLLISAHVITSKSIKQTHRKPYSEILMKEEHIESSYDIYSHENITPGTKMTNIWTIKRKLLRGSNATEHDLRPVLLSSHVHNLSPPPPP
jgi:hypothetical protein